MNEAMLAIFKDEIDERIAESEERISLQRAKTIALNLRNMAGMNDPVKVAEIVGVETELVERWFAE